jgi:hypothetical protein
MSTQIDALIAATAAVEQVEEAARALVDANIVLLTGSATTGPANDGVVQVTLPDATQREAVTQARLVAISRQLATGGTPPPPPNPVLPSNIQLSNLFVSENSSEGLLVGTLSASNATSFSLIVPAGGRFKFIAPNRIECGPVNIDYETAQSHSIAVRATNANGSTDVNFTIQVVDVSETSGIAISGPSEVRFAETGAEETSKAVGVFGISGGTSPYTINVDATGVAAPMSFRKTPNGPAIVGAANAFTLAELNASVFARTSTPISGPSYNNTKCILAEARSGTSVADMQSKTATDQSGNFRAGNYAYANASASDRVFSTRLSFNAAGTGTTKDNIPLLSISNLGVQFGYSEIIAGTVTLELWGMLNGAYVGTTPLKTLTPTDYSIVSNRYYLNVSGGIRADAIDALELRVTTTAQMPSGIIFFLSQSATYVLMSIVTASASSTPDAIASPGSSIAVQVRDAVGATNVKTVFLGDNNTNFPLTETATGNDVASRVILEDWSSGSPVDVFTMFTTAKHRVTAPGDARLASAYGNTYEVWEQFNAGQTKWMGWEFRAKRTRYIDPAGGLLDETDVFVQRETEFTNESIHTVVGSDVATGVTRKEFAFRLQSTDGNVLGFIDYYGARTGSIRPTDFKPINPKGMKTRLHRNPLNPGDGTLIDGNYAGRSYEVITDLLHRGTILSWKNRDWSVNPASVTDVFLPKPDPAKVKPWALRTHYTANRSRTNVPPSDGGDGQVKNMGQILFAPKYPMKFTDGLAFIDGGLDAPAKINYQGLSQNLRTTPTMEGWGYYAGSHATMRWVNGPGGSALDAFSVPEETAQYLVNRAGVRPIDNTPWLEIIRHTAMNYANCPIHWFDNAATILTPPEPQKMDIRTDSYAYVDAYYGSGVRVANAKYIKRHATSQGNPVFLSGLPTSGASPTIEPYITRTAGPVPLTTEDQVCADGGWQNSSQHNLPLSYWVPIIFKSPMRLEAQAFVFRNGMMTSATPEFFTSLTSANWPVFNNQQTIGQWTTRVSNYSAVHYGYYYGVCPDNNPIGPSRSLIKSRWIQEVRKLADYEMPLVNTAVNTDLTLGDKVCAYMIRNFGLGSQTGASLDFNVAGTISAQNGSMSTLVAELGIMAGEIAAKGQLLKDAEVGNPAVFASHKYWLSGYAKAVIGLCLTAEKANKVIGNAFVLMTGPEVIAANGNMPTLPSSWEQVAGDATRTNTNATIWSNSGVEGDNASWKSNVGYTNALNLLACYQYVLSPYIVDLPNAEQNIAALKAKVDAVEAYVSSRPAAEKTTARGWYTYYLTAAAGRAG